MFAQVNLKQSDQMWLVEPAAALTDEWHNSGCCAESLQPKSMQSAELPAAQDEQGEWWPGQCVL